MARRSGAQGVRRAVRPVRRRSRASGRALAAAAPLARLELLERARPVAVQEPRQRAIGEQSAAGLAGRAVVRLVLGIDDALHGRAAAGAGLTVAAVHRHAVAKRRHLLGETRARLGTEALDPLPEHRAGGGEERGRLAGGEIAGALEGRQLRPVQDLVGVGVADAGENVRVGERALERVALGGERGVELPRRRLERFQPARIVGGEGVGVGDRMERGALLGSRLGEHQAAPREVEGEQRVAAADRGPGRAPVEATGDHQVEDQERPPLEREDDPFAQPRETDDAPADQGSAAAAPPSARRTGCPGAPPRAARRRRAERGPRGRRGCRVARARLMPRRAMAAGGARRRHGGRPRARAASRLPRGRAATGPPRRGRGRAGSVPADSASARAGGGIRNPRSFQDSQRSSQGPAACHRPRRSSRYAMTEANSAAASGEPSLASRARPRLSSLAARGSSPRRAAHSSNEPRRRSCRNGSSIARARP